MTARLAFGLPVCNGERYVTAALDSLRAQTYTDIDIIISDNGSTDGTETICRRAAAADPRIRYFRSPENRGGIWNFTRVLKLSGSELFSWMAVDDIKLPSFASACISALDEMGTEAVFACTRTRLIDDDDVIFEDLNDAHMGMEAATPHQRLRNLYLTQAAHVMYGVIRSDALAKTRGINSLLGADMVLVTELLCLGKLVLSPEPEFLQRRSTGQVSHMGISHPTWFAPGSKTRFAFPNTVTHIELYRAVAHSQLDLTEKLRCWAQIAPNWVFPRWRGIARDIATAIGVNP